MDGIFLIDKPSGLTSHDVVYRIRRKFNIKKVGHTGTLDPFATGLMIILVGKATKLAFLFDDLDKGYKGNIILGKSYDTDDTTGTVLETSKVDMNTDMIKKAINDLQPSYMQLPPSYSAIKVNGIKSYHAARQGKNLALEPRLVNIYSFTYEIVNESILFDTHVSKGTYIRSIARDIGSSLDTFGALESLRRTIIGSYQVSAAKTIEDIESDDLIDHKLLFEYTPKIELNDYMVKLVHNGVALDHRQTNIEEPFIVTDQLGNYIAYYVPKDNEYKVKYYF
jgi:tRNA pseudouridine55 synthase